MMLFRYPKELGEDHREQVCMFVETTGFEKKKQKEMQTKGLKHVVFSLDPP